MPWKTIKRDCKQSSGKKGSHVVVKKKKDGGTEQESCHTSEEKAKSAIRARHANEGRTVKVTKRQLRRIIKEAIDIVNSETGELLVFEDDWEVKSDSGYSKGDAPESAARDIMKRLNITQLGSEIDGDIEDITVHPEDWEKMSKELYDKRRIRKNKRERERLDIHNLMNRLEQWAADAGGDYGADNPDVDMQDVAWDLSDAAQFEFKEDEWDELIWAFDGNEDDLRTFVADRIAG